MAYNPKDFYFKKAKEENFVARSVFKLEEMDKKFKLFRHGQTILDLGCAPGSWSQYVSKKIGHQGKLLGVDLAKVHLNLPNAVFVQGDAFSEEVLQNFMTENAIETFDLVISDMAPKTIGIRVTDQERSLQLCKRALDVALRTLKPGGHFIVKIFQGADTPEFTKSLRDHFQKVDIARPKSVRQQSFEVYILGLNKKNL